MLTFSLQYACSSRPQRAAKYAYPARWRLSTRQFGHCAELLEPLHEVSCWTLLGCAIGMPRVGAADATARRGICGTSIRLRLGQSAIRPSIHYLTLDLLNTSTPNNHSFDHPSFNEQMHSATEFYTRIFLPSLFWIGYAVGGRNLCRKKERLPSRRWS